MIALPSITSAPVTLTSAGVDPLAAKLALAIAGPDRIRLTAEQAPLEVRALQGTLRAWRFKAIEGMQIFKPGIHVSLGWQHAHCDGASSEADAYTVYLGANESYTFGTMWHLEPQWKELERICPGLAETALAEIEAAERYALPLYTPCAAEYLASWLWWRGEDDESEVIAEYRDESGEDAPIPEDIELRSRKAFDARLPKVVCRPQRKLRERQLEQLRRRRGVAGEVAGRVLELRAAGKLARRRKEPEFHRQDEDSTQAVNYAGMVRWNGNDPMPELFDDWANECAQCSGVQEVYGWYTPRGPQDIPAVLAAIERRLELARHIERLLPLIARRED